MRREDVLIIHDGTPFLQTIGQILASQGYRTSIADNAEDSLLELAEKYFRLVIVKLNGKESGYLAAMNLVKQLNPAAKLIVLGDGAPLPVAAFQGEVDDFILLPCRPAEVWRRIKNCLEGAKETAGREKLQGVNGRVLDRLSVLFHDLRGGLASLAGALELLQRRSGEQPDSELTGLLTEARHQTGRLEGLLNRFLANTVFSPETLAAEDSLDLRPDGVEPVSEELEDDFPEDRPTQAHGLDFLPSYLGMAGVDGSHIHRHRTRP